MAGAARVVTPLALVPLVEGLDQEIDDATVYAPADTAPAITRPISKPPSRPAVPTVAIIHTLPSRIHHAAASTPMVGAGQAGLTRPADLSHQLPCCRPGVPASWRSAWFTSFRYSWTNCTAIAPSPTAEATRLTDPDRTSPAAKTPGRLASSRNG